MAELITAAEQLQASKLNQLISAAEDLLSQIYGTATTNTGLPPDMAPRWFAAQSKLIEAVDELARHVAAEGDGTTSLSLARAPVRRADRYGKQANISPESAAC